MQLRKDGKEREGDTEKERERECIIFQAMSSQHVNVMHVLIGLEIFRGHVPVNSYGLKLSLKELRVCVSACAASESSTALCLING